MVLKQLDDQFEKWELYHQDRLISSGEGYDIGDQVASNFRSKYQPETFRTLNSSGKRIVTESMVKYDVDSISDLSTK